MAKEAMQEMNERFDAQFSRESENERLVRGAAIVRVNEGIRRHRGLIRRHAAMSSAAMSSIDLSAWGKALSGYLSTR